VSCGWGRRALARRRDTVVERAIVLGKPDVHSRHVHITRTSWGIDKPAARPAPSIPPWAAPPRTWIGYGSSDPQGRAGRVYAPATGQSALSGDSVPSTKS